MKILIYIYWLFYNEMQTITLGFEVGIAFAKPCKTKFLIKMQQAQRKQANSLLGYKFK